MPKEHVSASDQIIEDQLLQEYRRHTIMEMMRVRLDELAAELNKPVENIGWEGEGEHQLAAGGVEILGFDYKGRRYRKEICRQRLADPSECNGETTRLVQALKDWLESLD